MSQQTVAPKAIPKVVSGEHTSADFDALSIDPNSEKVQRQTLFHQLISPEMPPYALGPGPRHELLAGLNELQKTWHPNFEPLTARALLPPGEGFEGADVAIILTGQTFRSGVSQNYNTKHGLEAPCNMSSISAQREATFSVVENVISPLEERGARVTVFFSAPTCAFCVPRCHMNHTRSEYLTGLLVEWLRSRPSPHGTPRQIVQKPLVEGYCDGMVAMQYLWFRWVQQARQGREFDYVFQARQDVVMPVHITEWKGDLTKILFHSASWACTSECTELLFIPGGRVKIPPKKCSVCVRDLFYWVPLAHTAAFRRAVMELRYCGHQSIYAVAHIQPSVPLEDIGFMFPDCDYLETKANADWPYLKDVCPEALMYRPRRPIEVPSDQGPNDEDPSDQEPNDEDENDRGRDEGGASNPNSNPDPPVLHAPENVIEGWKTASPAVPPYSKIFKGVTVYIADDDGNVATFVASGPAEDMDSEEAERKDLRFVLNIGRWIHKPKHWPPGEETIPLWPGFQVRTGYPPPSDMQSKESEPRGSGQSKGEGYRSRTE